MIPTTLPTVEQLQSPPSPLIVVMSTTIKPFSSLKHAFYFFQQLPEHELENFEVLSPLYTTNIMSFDAYDPPYSITVWNNSGYNIILTGEIFLSEVKLSQ